MFTSMQPIVVTTEQYWTIAFILFLGASFYTMKQIFPYPDERDNDDEF